MNKPVFTKSISAGTRVYYIDANKDKKGQYYVSISEIPTDKTPGVKNGSAFSFIQKGWTNLQTLLPKSQNVLKMTLKDDALILLGWSCPYCGRPTRLVDSSVVYGRSYGCKCYYCEPCQAWVGCHKGTDKALGRIADKYLRELKRQAHESFDRIWNEGYTKRNEAYRLLSEALGLPVEQTHIGMFDEDLCRRTISLSKIMIGQFENKSR